MISNSVKFLLNDKILEIKNPDPNQTILNYIRTELKKTGTKEGCSEGGCGACTIVLGELVSNEIKYSSINSCISFVPSLNGKQLLIVEDLVSKDGKLHPVQEAMVKFHGSQCGFCTPGFVMSLFAMYKNYSSYKDKVIEDSIAGNLCRCTGYRPIIDAAKSLNNNKQSDHFDKIKKKDPEKQIIFICGMPRSGSTLIEQMIAAHNEVSGAGELSYVRDTVAKNFLEELRFNKQKIIEEASAERNILAEQYIEIL